MGFACSAEVVPGADSNLGLLSEETAEGTPLSICVAHKTLQPWHPSSAWQLCQLQLIFVRPQLLQDTHQAQQDLQQLRQNSLG